MASGPMSGRGGIDRVDRMTTHEAQLHTVDRPAGARRRRRILIVLAAAAGALAVWAILGPIGGLDLTVSSGGRTDPVGAPAVFVSSIVAGLAGWGLLAVLERTVPRPALVWRIIAAIVLAVSLLGPIGAATTTGTAWALAGLHMTVAAVLIAQLPHR
jgi:hypothetical protein